MSTTSHWLPKFCGCWLRRRCTVASDRPHESDLRGSRRPADSRFSAKHRVVSQSPGPVLESERVRRSTIADSCVDGDIKLSGLAKWIRSGVSPPRMGIRIGNLCFDTKTASPEVGVEPLACRSLSEAGALAPRLQPGSSTLVAGRSHPTGVRGVLGSKSRLNLFVCDFTAVECEQ